MKIPKIYNLQFIIVFVVVVFKIIIMTNGGEVKPNGDIALTEDELSTHLLFMFIFLAVRCISVNGLHH